MWNYNYFSTGLYHKYEAKMKNNTYFSHVYTASAMNLEM